MTYGACLRSRSISYNGVFSTRSAGFGRGDATAQRKWDNELNAFRSAVGEGIEPAGTTMPKIREAVELSDKAGKAWQASSRSFKD